MWIHTRPWLETLLGDARCGGRLIGWGAIGGEHEYDQRSPRSTPTTAQKPFIAVEYTCVRLGNRCPAHRWASGHKQPAQYDGRDGYPGRAGIGGPNRDGVPSLDDKSLFLACSETTTIPPGSTVPFRFGAQFSLCRCIHCHGSQPLLCSAYPVIPLGYLQCFV